jgi:ABC-type branched-subunit amino acid transport system permease subunit
MSGSLTAGLLAPVGLLAIVMGQDVGNPSEYQFAISGLLLVVMAVIYPDGITGFIRSTWHRLTRRSHSGGNVAERADEPVAA